MKQELLLKHQFVEFIPEDLEPEVLYLSIRYKTGTHLCCCGCGNIVVTPISPTDWKLTFDGKTVSLHPSIGNWSFPCQSHYWIKNGRVEWAQKWSSEEIERGRSQDNAEKARYFGTDTKTSNAAPTDASSGTDEIKPSKGFWRLIKKWLS